MSTLDHFLFLNLQNIATHEAFVLTLWGLDIKSLLIGGAFTTLFLSSIYWLLVLSPKRVHLSRWIGNLQNNTVSIHENYNKLLAFLNGTQDLIQSVDENGRYQFVNQAWCDSLGYTLEEAKGLSIFDVIHPRYHEQCHSVLSVPTEEDSGSYLELSFLNKYGEEVFVSGHISVYKINVKHILTIGVFRDDFERIAVKRAKEETDLKCRLIAANSKDIIALYRNKQMIYVSPSVKTTLGYSCEEFMQMDRSALIHAADFDLVHQKSWDQSKIEGKNDPFEYRFKVRNGEFRWLEANSQSVSDNEGQVLTTFIVRDITKRKEAEQELSRTKAILEQTNELAKLGGWEADLTNNQLYFSPVANQILGRPRDYEPAIEDVITMCKERPELQNLYKTIRSAIKKGESFDVEFKLNRQDVKPFWVRIIGRAEIKNKQCVRLYGSFQDINERKEIEERIRESESKFRSFVENAIEIVFALNLDGVFTYVSPNWKELLGHSVDEVIGRSFTDFVTPDTVDSGFEAIRIIMETGQSVKTRPYKVTHKNGDILWNIVSASPVKDEKGSIVSFMGIAHDITEKLAYEESLKKAKEEAIAASKAKSMFLANLSHEIRTPLNSVIGFTDLLIKTELNHSQKQYMSSVNHSANTLLDLINDILDFSKIEAGKLEISNQKTDLWELVEMLVEIVRFKVKDSVELLLNIDIDLPKYAYVDSVRLRQVLMNLLINAAKFTDKGEIEISIQILNNHDVTLFDKAYRPIPTGIIFSVKDTGIGVKPEKQSEIFQAFQQEDGSTTRKYGGTGLGLAISNQLLNLMNTHLQLESEVGVGSTFSFVLHCLVENSQDSFDPKGIKYNRVLLVNAHPKNLSLFGKMLERYNIPYESACSGPDAVQALQTDSYDVMILDYDMACLKKLEILGHLKKNFPAIFEALDIVLMHNATDNKKIDRAVKKYKIKHILTKPVSIRKLREALMPFENKKIDQEPLHESQTVRSLSAERMSILVADDNQVNQGLAETMIQKILPDSIILRADNGREAVEKWNKYRPELIIMDIQMPEMSGYEATRIIREKEGGLRSVPIIALTAGTVKGERERCMEAGMDEYLSKPFLLQDIEQVIHTYLLQSEHDQTKALLFSHIREMVVDDNAFRDILHIARENLLDLKNALNVSWSESNWIELKKISHNIRGVALNLGANDLVRFSSSLEADVLQEKEKIFSIYNKLDKEVAAVNSQLNQSIKDLQS